jgi:hypothetical protein
VNGQRVPVLTIVVVAMATGLQTKWGFVLVGISMVTIVGAILVLALRRGVYPIIRFGSFVVGWWQPDCRWSYETWRTSSDEEQGQGSPEER